MTRAFLNGEKAAEKFLKEYPETSRYDFMCFVNNKAVEAYKKESTQQQFIDGCQNIAEYYLFCSNRYVAQGIKTCVAKINRHKSMALREQNGESFLFTPGEKHRIIEEHDKAWKLLTLVGVKREHMRDLEGGFLGIPSFEVSQEEMNHAELIFIQRDYEVKIEQAKKAVPINYRGLAHYESFYKQATEALQEEQRERYKDLKEGDIIIFQNGDYVSQGVFNRHGKQHENGVVCFVDGKMYGVHYASIIDVRYLVRLPDNTVYEPVENDIHVEIADSSESNCTYKVTYYNNGEWSNYVIVTNFGANSLEYYLQGYRLIVSGKTEIEGYYTMRWIKETEDMVRGTFKKMYPDVEMTDTQVRELAISMINPIKGVK